MADLAVAAALVLVEEVLSFLNRELTLKSYVFNEVNQIGNKLRMIQAHIKDNEGKEQNHLTKESVNQFRRIAYDVEGILDRFMLHAPRQYQRHRILERVYTSFHNIAHLKSFHAISSKIKSIDKHIESVMTLTQLPAVDSVREEGMSSGSAIENLVTSNALRNNEIIGFQKTRDNIISQVKSSESRCLIIAVAGPLGSGKSTLVNSVYESKEVRRQFDCHAWVHLTNSFNFKNLLSQFHASRGESNSCQGVDTQEELKQYLQHKSYLVVIDHVRSEQDYNHIRNALPTGLCSRIIVTTRNSDVAVRCSDFIHRLSGLPWTEAWQLFCMNAFRASNGACPPELMGCSKKIVDKCEGLPLAIVAIGGLLSKKPHIPREWEKVFESLGSAFGSDSSGNPIVSRILLPSYNDLPCDLKSCLLYFSIFTETNSINRGRLVRLWVSERLVKERSGKTLEEVAEDSLNELVARNLVQVSKRDFDGRVRSCRLHYLLLKFIVKKSEEDNFVSVFRNSDRNRCEIVRRLSIQGDCNAWPQASRLASVRSVFSFMNENIGRFHFKDFELLRVLDLQGAPLETFPEGIACLTLLRYISFKDTKIKTVPKCIKKFSYLETLDLRQTHVIELPKKISRLQNLCNLLVYRYNVDNYVTSESVQGMKMFEGIGELTNLQKLSLVKLDRRGKIINELDALTQLRKLGLTNLKMEHGKELCASIETMKDLSTFDVCSTSKEECLDLQYISNPPHHLRCLHLKGHLRKLPEWISSLASLIRISLWWSRLQNSPLEVLQRLPNLMELHMVNAYVGDELEFAAGRFRNLNTLHIEEFDRLHTVMIQEGAMHKLQKLTLSKCVKLKMIPLGINYLSAVKELLLYDMHEAFIAQLQKGHENREMVAHILIIHSFTLNHNRNWVLQNLS